MKECTLDPNEISQLQKWVSTYLSQLEDKEMIRKNITMIPTYPLTTGIIRARKDLAFGNYSGLGHNIGTLIELMFKEANEPNTLPIQVITENVVIDFPFANDMTPEIISQVQAIYNGCNPTCASSTENLL